MAYELPALPCDINGLEPFIDTLTMEIHHDKHHATYVTNFNKLVAGKPDLENKPIEQLLRNLNDVPAEIRTGVRNHGGGALNHSFYWSCLAPGGPTTPEGKLGHALHCTFGSFEAFKEKFEAAGLSRFGSGWVWLVANQGKLEICSTPNQDTPIMGKDIAGCQGTPILVADLWEHAYYLRYQNRRGDYLKAIWNVINWSQIAKNYEATL